MAAQTGNWIKMRIDLRSHPKVVRMASALKADKLRVIGGLWAVWCVFDAHSPDGSLDGYTLQAMDDEIGWRGFCSAMAAPGIAWLIDTGNGLEAPRYDEHNGASAKRRALDNDRKKSARALDKGANGSWNGAGHDADDPPPIEPTGGGHLSAFDADINRTREEKRRSNTPQPPKGEGRFAEFWTSWPNTERKADRKKCLAKWLRNGWDSEADAILPHVTAMKATRKWLDGFEPAPLTYLNGERWRDGVAVEAGGSDLDSMFRRGQA